jgi:hypothetical protein
MKRAHPTVTASTMIAQFGRLHKARCHMVVVENSKADEGLSEGVSGGAWLQPCRPRAINDAGFSPRDGLVYLSNSR